MNIKAATISKYIKLGADVIEIEPVKGDPNLFRININTRFKGYVIREGEQFSLTNGSDVHQLLFARICDCIKNNVCT